MARGRSTDVSLVLERLENKIDETQRSMLHLDKKQDLFIQKMEYELDKINSQDKIQNALLDKHIEGVNTLKAMHLDHVKSTSDRFEKVEAPSKWFSLTSKGLVRLGAIATGIAGIVALFSHFFM